MAKLEKKNVNQLGEAKQMDHMKVESSTIGDLKINKHTAEKGWQWTKHLKPLVGTDTCQREHIIYVISGTMVVKMDDGQELEFGPGDFGDIPAGHDGWNSGEEPLVWLEFLHL